MWGWIKTVAKWAAIGAAVVGGGLVAAGAIAGMVGGIGV